MNEQNSNEVLKETLDLYDKIINACMVNTYSLSDDGKIILKDFNPKLVLHLFEFEVATIVHSIHPSREIYVNMSLFTYLLFKWKNRKKVKMKRIGNNDAQKSKLDIEDMLTFVSKAFEQNNEIYDEIYRLYWKERK